MNDFEPISDQRFLVQFTKTEGGDWHEDGYFKTDASARQRMQHLVDALGKASARVLHELAYYARPVPS